MKTLFSLFILLFIHINVHAQEKKNPIIQVDTMKPSPIPPPVSTPARYPGGMKEFNKVFIEEFRVSTLPDSIKTITIVLNFNVEKDSTLTNIKTVNNTKPKISTNATDVLKKMKWIPMKHGDKIIRSLVTIPITIQIR